MSPTRPSRIAPRALPAAVPAALRDPVSATATALGLLGLLALGIGAVAAFGSPALIALTAALAGAGLLTRSLCRTTDELATSREEALSDALTGLGNRRALSRALALRLARGEQTGLVLFDLDGFKHYNDTFGHPAGDALLARLGSKLAGHIGDRGAVFRMGGDEFCALLHPLPGDLEDAAEAAARVLVEHGDGFAIASSHGAVRLPEETGDPSIALRFADERMYARKHSRRVSADRQSRDVLLRALAERKPELSAHLSGVASLAADVARGLELPEPEVEQIRQAAELHDVGKMAIPDVILDKPGPLDPDEWEFIHRHTIIGERIVGAAPALLPVATMVRASHERFDGRGYPDRLKGEEIPLGARIVAVCDAFDAMVADRSYRDGMPPAHALAELDRCAGTQFDPTVVRAFGEVWAARERALTRV